MPASLADFMWLVLGGSIALNTWFMRRELADLRATIKELRTDFKEYQKSEAELKEEIARIKARCDERHK